MGIWFVEWTKAKVCAALVVVLLVLGSSGVVGRRLYVRWERSVQRKQDAILQGAVQAERNGELEAAEKSFRRYLKVRPENTDALVGYGLLLDKRAKSPQERRRVLPVYEQVLVREPGREAIRRRIVQIAMELNDHRVAQWHVEYLRKTLPGEGELEYFLGKCYEGGMQFDKAAERYAKAIERGPRQVEAYVRWSSLLRRRLGDPAAADRLMDQLIKANDQSARAYLERGRYRSTFGLDGDKADIARARELAPDDLDILLAAALLARDPATLEANGVDLGKAIERHPRDSRLYLARAGLEERRGRTDEAVTYLRQGEKVAVETTVLRWRLANMLMDAGRMDEAAGVVEELRKAKVAAPISGYLGARLLASQGKWADAARELEGIRASLAESPDGKKSAAQADLLLARCYEQLQDRERRLAALRRAVETDPTGHAVRLALAEALTDSGNVGEALVLYRDLAADAPRLRIIVARQLLLLNLRQPSDQRHWQDVDQALDEARRALPEAPPELALVRAAVLMAREQESLARDILEDARDRHPDRADLWVALAEVTSALEVAESGQLILDEAQRRLGERIELRRARLTYVLNPRRRSEVLEGLAELEKGSDTFSKKDRRLLLEELAMAYAQVGAARDADRLWDRLLEQYPTDLALRLKRFEQALRGEDKDALTRALDEIRRVEGEGQSWSSYDEARLLVWQARRGDKAGLPRARQLLVAVVDKRPAWAVLPVCQAEIEDLSEDRGKAIAFYQRALAMGELDPASTRRLVDLLYANEQYDEADRLVRKLEIQMPLTGELRRLAGDLALRTHDSDRALESARKAVDDGSRDYRDFLWLGQVLWAVGRRDEAEPVFRRAVAMSAGAPDPWVTLVEHLSRTGLVEKAAATVRQAERTLSREKFPLILAYCYELIHRRDEADALYKAALAEKPDDPSTLCRVVRYDLRAGRRSEAEALLRKLLGLKDVTPNDALWGRRTLALAIAEGGDYQRSQEALALVGGLAVAEEKTGREGGAASALAAATATAGKSPATIEDDRIKALVLAQQHGRPHRKEAIRLLEGLIERFPDQADDRFVLGQLHEADGNWPKARLQFLVLLATHGDNPLYIAHYARGLLRRGDRDEARLLLAKLQEFEPGGSRAVEIEARILQSQGEGDKAVALLKGYAERPGQEAVIVEKVAALLEELGQNAAAEAMLRALIARSSPPRPESVLNLALFLARRNRAQEALDLCAGAWASGNPESVAGACEFILTNAAVSNGDRQRVSKWLEEAIGAHPQSAMLRLYLGNLRVSAGHSREGDALYRQAVERDKDGTAALNNLAYLLALEHKDVPEALTLINRAIARAGPIAELLDTRALVYLALGQSRPAIKDLEQANALAPTAAQYYHLCQAHQAAHDFWTANAAYQKGIATGLSEEKLHPLERKGYQKLAAELKKPR